MPKQFNLTIKAQSKNIPAPSLATWITATNGVDHTKAWNSVCYGNGLFVARATTAFLMTSPDGVNWTNREPVPAGTCQSVCYGKGMFVSVCSAGTFRVIISYDGINWEGIPTLAGTGGEQTTDGTWSSVCYGKDKFVAVSSATTTTAGTLNTMTSEDGENWTSRDVLALRGFKSVCYSKNQELFVAVGTAGAVMTSKDGISWIQRTAGEANVWNSVCYAEDKQLFVAVSQAGTNRIMTSPNGITWTARAAPQANAWQSVCYGNGMFVAVSTAGTNRVITSPNGITWTLRTASAATSWAGIGYGEGRFVALASSTTGNRVMYSS